jgi:hypothetical protein
MLLTFLFGTSIMEDLCERIPLIRDLIFKNVNNQTLINCRISSKRLQQVLDQDKNNWTRIILKYECNFMYFKESWKKVLCKTPTGIIKKLSLGIHELNEQSVSKNMMIYTIYYRPVTLFELKRWSPLHIAAACGDLELCNYIVQKTGDINPKDFRSVTPLHLAAHKGHLHICKLIANSLKDTNPPDDFGMTPLHISASGENLKLFQFFLDTAVVKNPETKVGMTPLHFAARDGKTKVCELIINAVQDKNPRNHRGNTPLQEAAETRHWTLKLHKLLSDNGADLDPIDDNEFAAMQALCEQSEPSMTFWAIYTVFSFSVIYTAFRMSSL